MGEAVMPQRRRVDAQLRPSLGSISVAGGSGVAVFPEVALNDRFVFLISIGPIAKGATGSTECLEWE
jgi:hypothetical protein